MHNSPKVLVVGDLMIDHYLWGSANRISPEAPVQVVDIDKETTVLGGAGNVVNNLRALGCEVSVISVVGDDDVAHELKSMLDAIDTKSYLVKEDERKTSKKSRIIASHSQVVRYDKESKENITKSSESEVLKNFSTLCAEVDIVLLSDYGKGVLTTSLTKDIINIAKSKNKKVLVDPKGLDYSKYSGAYLLTPNKKEAQEASGINITDDNSLVDALKKLKDVAKLDISLITLSEDGIAIFDDKLIMRPTVAREVYDVTGAGDTVLASLGYSLASGKDIVSALEFANLAAGVVVGKLGSATATIDEIEHYRASINKTSIDAHIKSFEELKIQVERLKKLGKKIVFTNGCFDILHRGHVSYLDIAKSYGDVLILGLNSDASVRKLKGESRPINSEEDRAFVLSALESVDFVTVFSDETPYELIKMVEPDVLVKGGDYEGKEVVGSDIAREVKLVQFVDGKSTTKTIAKIQSCEC
ncbi:D-glycero-beta-D-manno-heptose-7-phosphate kinase [Sulfurimonas lithotrophica]|uniref:Bifunctional protein HldE n=1 Tax=Sulfurimonas lithotrophica TaxID=2590022 RepID=A0A5P8NYZ9_9BACT|nr:D-glycero-beta-D-manno-heptose-7-phosphate kinase [Sulfurimonas lithotrophica]QFR48669.1 D-glycero-beta-D-manno-heptose-7-phosphate kinase [Sulfurimonas lithotrophica]